VSLGEESWCASTHTKRAPLWSPSPSPIYPHTAAHAFGGRSSVEPLPDSAAIFQKPAHEEGRGRALDESEKIFRFWVVFMLIVIAAGGFAHVAQVLSPIAIGIGILGILGLLVGILVGAVWLLHKIGDYAIRGWQSALVKYAVRTHLFRAYFQDSWRGAFLRA
jgi:hypothetical protein